MPDNATLVQTGSGGKPARERPWLTAFNDRANSAPASESKVAMRGNRLAGNSQDIRLPPVQGSQCQFWGWEYGSPPK